MIDLSSHPRRASLSLVYSSQNPELVDFDHEISVGLEVCLVVTPGDADGCLHISVTEYSNCSSTVNSLEYSKLT